jgi:peptidoglycan/LPS O-acetylase OafA/YrhL
MSEQSVVEPSHAGHESRVTSLDGLRGVAALLVVFHHVALASITSIAQAYLDVPPKTGTVAWVFYSTPVHILWGGADGVLLFFVLSGYVLTLPALKRGVGWLDVSYYPRRLIRLYLPVWGALILAVAIHRSVSHAPITGATWWLNAHSIGLAPAAGLDLASLLHLPYNGAGFTTVLWSLRWEMWFSLLLPALVLIPITTRGRPRLAVGWSAVALVVIGVGSAKSVAYLQFMPGFVLGSLLAFHIDRVKAVIGRVGRFAVTTGVVIGAILLVSPEELASVRHTIDLQVALAFVGASLLLVVALMPGWFASFLSSPPIHWLGIRSFSLYLVHEPVVVALAFAFGGHPNPELLFLTAVPTSLLLCDLFYRAVERPSIHLARLTGQWVLSKFNGRSAVRSRARSAI